MAINDLAPRLQALTAPQLQALLLRVASDPAARPVVERALAASERLPTAPAREGFKPLLKTRMRRGGTDTQDWRTRDKKT